MCIHNKKLSWSKSNIKKERPESFLMYLLFLAEVNINGHAFKIINLTQFVFYKTFIRIFDILRQVRKKHKLRNSGWQLHTVFNFDVFTLNCRRRIIFDNR